MDSARLQIAYTYRGNRNEVKKRKSKLRLVLESVQYVDE